MASRALKKNLTLLFFFSVSVTPQAQSSAAAAAAHETFGHEVEADFKKVGAAIVHEVETLWTDIKPAIVGDAKIVVDALENVVEKALRTFTVNIRNKITDATGLTAATTTPTTVALGWHPSSHEHLTSLGRTKGVHLQFVQNKMLHNIDLPDSASLENADGTFVIPVLNQGPLGACVSHAVGIAIKHMALQKDPQAELDARLMIYHNAVEIDGTLGAGDVGTTFASAFQGLATKGACPESIYPYRTDNTFEKTPPAECYAAAQQHELARENLVVTVISGESAETLLHNLRVAIAVHKRPLLVGLPLWDSFMSDEVAKTGIVPFPNRSKPSIGGHALCFYGYASGWWYGQNSWGEEWGDHGKFRVSDEYMSKLAMEIVALGRPDSLTVPAWVHNFPFPDFSHHKKARHHAIQPAPEVADVPTPSATAPTDGVVATDVSVPEADITPLPATDVPTISTNEPKASVETDPSVEIPASPVTPPPAPQTEDVIPTDGFQPASPPAGILDPTAEHPTAVTSVTDDSVPAVSDVAPVGPSAEVTEESTDEIGSLNAQINKISALGDEANQAMKDFQVELIAKRDGLTRAKNRSIKRQKGGKSTTTAQIAQALVSMAEATAESTNTGTQEVISDIVAEMEDIMKHQKPSPAPEADVPPAEPTDVPATDPTPTPAADVAVPTDVPATDPTPTPAADVTAPTDVPATDPTPTPAADVAVPTDVPATDPTPTPAADVTAPTDVPATDPTPTPAADVTAPTDVPATDPTPTPAADITAPTDVPATDPTPTPAADVTAPTDVPATPAPATDVTPAAPTDVPATPAPATDVTPAAPTDVPATDQTPAVDDLDKPPFED